MTGTYRELSRGWESSTSSTKRTAAGCCGTIGERPAGRVQPLLLTGEGLEAVATFYYAAAAAYLLLWGTQVPNVRSKQYLDLRSGGSVASI